jgi:uncharacterized membrane protein YjgN (DUF898 family)
MKSKNTEKNASRYTGSLLGQIGINILTTSIILCTLSLGAPFALVIKYKYEARNTFIDNKQLEFTGTAIKLFSFWALSSLLTLITCGIYGFWFALNFKKWKIKHTVFKTN